jgi:hypothetical protein
VPGGVFTAVIGTVATTGAYLAAKDQSQLAVGLRNVTDFCSPTSRADYTPSASPFSGEEPAALAGGDHVQRRQDRRAVRFYSRTSRRKIEASLKRRLLSR